MSKKQRFPLLIIVFVLIFTFGGCKFSVESADKLLRPPKSGAEIEAVIEKFAGDSIVFKAPANSSSEHSSALTLVDLDSDGTEEAVAFYTTSSNDTNVHMNVLKLINDEWVSIGDCSGYGSNVETVSFKNLSKNTSQSDIVVTWSYIDSNVLTVHKLSGEGRRTQLRKVCDESYASMGYVDVDGDGFYELFFISDDFSDKEKVPFAKVIKIDKYDVLNIGMISLSRDIIGFTNSHCQEINNKNIPMIAVYDYINSDGMYATDVVYWDNKSYSLNIMQVDKATNSAFSTSRDVDVLSSDINADTLIEIPVQEPVIGSYVNEKTYNSALSYTKWCELLPDDDGIKLKSCGNYRFYFTDKDYFDVNESWISEITVVKNTEKDIWNVTTYNSEDFSENQVLLTVRMVSQDNFDKYISDGYKQLSSYTKDSKVIMYKITKQGKSFGIKESNLVNVKL